MIRFANGVYELIKIDCEGLDAVYEDYILKMVGVHGLNVLLEHNFIESCGMINGRRLYTLVDREPIRYPDEYESLKAENERLKTYILHGR